MKEQVCIPVEMLEEIIKYVIQREESYDELHGWGRGIESLIKDGEIHPIYFKLIEIKATLQKAADNENT